MRCFTVLGPSQTGKSTVLEKLGSLEGRPTTFSTPYGLTLSQFEFLGEPWCGLDTPGSNEALGHAQDALLASDAAILCVSPDPEEAVLAAPYLRAIEASETPTILFVNRIDEAKSRLRDVVAALQGYCSHPLVLRQIPIREGDQIVGSCDLISERAWRYREGQPSALVELPAELIEREHEAREAMLEHFADYDQWLLEELIEDREPAGDAVFAIATRVLKENRIIPVMVGAASHSNGMMRLMKALRHEAPSPETLRERLAAAGGMDESALQAVSFHGFHRQSVGKTVLVRALVDGIRQGGTLAGGGLGAVQDPATQRPFPSGSMAAGAIFAAAKSDHLPIPALLAADRAHPVPDWSAPPPPVLERILAPINERDETKLSGILAKLAETDHSLIAMQQENSGAQMVCVRGPVHLREVCRMLADVFKVEVKEKTPEPSYCETVSRGADVHYRHRKQTGGAGQFADVKLALHPNERGSGFSFAETVKGGAVPKNYIPAVEAGAREAMERGPLGFPVIDVGVTLTDGQHHSVDSSDFAFRAAGRMGVKQALEQAASVLMQPIYRIEIHIPSIYSGALVPIVSSFRGQVLGFDRDETAQGWDVFRALLPGNALDDFSHSLRAATQGIGDFAKAFDHFEELYGKEADAIVTANGARAAAG
ncbi:MAG TPA: elongation factor G [Pararhizobium sp.]|nr:elongation factor G [Pararhizobium sp.]